MHAETPKVAGPVGRAPRRRPSSFRRTTSMDISWPAGRKRQMHLHGRARDIFTVSPDAAPLMLATATMDVDISPAGQIEAIAVSPARDGVERLVGCVARGRRLRTLVDEVLPGERAAGTALHLLLDDISAAGVISLFAWSRDPVLWAEMYPAGPRTERENVCVGWRAGSSAHQEAVIGTKVDRTARVESVVRPDDPEGWHELAEAPVPSVRRVRRIDVWEETGAIVVDSSFQDSSPDGAGRVACHEYVLRATADPVTMTLSSVDPEARVLPYPECPLAIEGARSMAGVALAELRTVVLERLAREHGCTHLNDALRALADVPPIVEQLRRLHREAPARSS